MPFLVHPMGVDLFQLVVSMQQRLLKTTVGSEEFYSRLAEFLDATPLLELDMIQFLML